MICNLEIEKSVLGGMILENSLIKKALGKIKQEFFYFENMKKLFNAILTAYDKHGSVDFPILGDFDMHFLADVCNTYVTSESWKKHCIILHDLFIRREIQKASEKIKTLSENSDIDNIDTLKAEALSLINDIKTPESNTITYKIQDISIQALNSLEKKYKQGTSSYLSWKLNWLQDKTGGIKAEYTILSARPSVGKTALALQIATRVAVQGAKVVIFSLEMMADSVFSRMLSNYANIDKSYFDKPHLLDDKKYSEIQLQAARLAQLPIKIYDSIFSIEEIILKCEEAKATDGLDFVVVDYIQLIETSKKTNNTNERVSYISRSLKKLQQKSNIHVLALSQLNRESERNDFPTLAHLRDSGSLEQDANNVFMLHPEVSDDADDEKLYQNVWLLIAKQREGERNIKTKLKFYGRTQKFYDK